MNIELPVYELKTALPGLQRIVSKSPSIPVLRCVKIHRAQTGLVRLQATNLDDYASLNIETPAKDEPVEMLVPFEPLFRIVKGCSPKDTLELTPEGEVVKVRYSIGTTPFEQKLEAGKVEDWPASPVIASTLAITVDQSFKEAIQAAFACVSEDTSRYILNHAFVDVSDPKAHYVVGTDGKHIYAANSFHLNLKESLIVPHLKFLLWPGFINDGFWTVTVQPPVENTPGQIQIQSKHWTLITRQIDGKYPCWQTAFPTMDQTKTVVEFDDNALSWLCLALPQLPGHDDNHQPVTFILAEGKCFIQGKADKEEQPLLVEGAKISGPETTITLNRNLALKAFKWGLREMVVYGTNIPALFKHGGKRLLVAPMNPGSTPNNSVPGNHAQDSSPETKDNEMKPTNRITEPPVNSTPREEPVNRIQSGNGGNSGINITGNNAGAKEETPAIPAIKQAIAQVESLKEHLKSVTGGLTDLLKLLSQAHRENRATEREVEEIRESVRSLQRIKI